jgi:hypothetical protein
VASNPHEPDDIVEHTWATIEAGEVPAPTWALLRRLMNRDGQAPAIAKAGAWAIDVLERELGVDWPSKQFDRQGFVPAFALWSTGHSAAFHELLEVALRLDARRSEPGFAALRKVLRDDHRHAFLQLEVASLAAAAGHSVAFERAVDGSPVDVTFGSVSVEAFTLFTDQELRSSQRYSERLMAERRHLEFVHGVALDGGISIRLDEAGTANWLTELGEVAQRVSVTGLVERFVGAGWDVTVSPEPVAGSGFRGPPIEGRGWERISARVRGKAAQLEGPGGGRWLRADLRDGTYGFTGWSRQPFGERYGDLAIKLAQDIGAAAIDGIVVSSGAVFVQGTMIEESCRTATGASAIARGLGSYRGRETLVVPLTGQAMA